MKLKFKLDDRNKKSIAKVDWRKLKDERKTKYFDDNSQLKIATNDRDVTLTPKDLNDAILKGCKGSSLNCRENPH